MRKYIAIYRANHVPRFHRDVGTGQRMREAFLASSVLWDAAQVHFAEKLGISVELRISTNGLPQDDNDAFGKSSLFLLLACPPNRVEEGLATAKEFDHLLPEEYGWCRIPDAEDQLFMLRLGWKIARLIRRVEFVDLPLIKERRGVSEPVISSAGSKTNLGDNTLPPLTRSTLGSVPPDGSNANWLAGIRPRILPGYDRRSIARELRRATPCLPMLGKLSSTGEVPHRLFRQLQRVAPAIISMAIHPVDKDSLRRDRIVATAWGQLLQGFVPSGTGDAGASHAAGELAAAAEALHRYWLPESYLANVSIQVATQDAMQSMGIAHHLCALFGGMKAFEVRPPKVRDGIPVEVDLKDLGRADADIPSPEGGSWDPSRWEKERADWYARLKYVGMSVPDGANDDRLDFLARFRHLYTLEELKQILALPVADEEGLAGVDSQLMSPFSSPQFRYDPVAEVTDHSVAYEDPNRIRVGVLRTKSLHGEKSVGANHEGEHWHTIEKNDLSKHALIVGSTGSGKTQTTLFLARELFRVGVPFTIIEPVKTEYFDRLAPRLNAIGNTDGVRLRRFNFESDPVRWRRKDGRDADGVKSSRFLPFDPMRLQKGVSVARHTSYLKSCFEAAFPLTPPLAMVLETGIRRYYTDPREDGGCGLRLFQTGGPEVHTVEKKLGRIFPSLRTFTDYFCGTFLKHAFPDHGKDTQEVLDFFRRRFDNLASGLIGESSRAADACLFLDRDRRRYEMFSLLLNNAARREMPLSTVIELDGIPDAEQKALVMAFLMTFLFEYRQAEDMALRRTSQGAGPAGLRHVLIVEEAHRLLANSASHGSRGGDWTGVDSQKKAVSLFTDMLSEMRAYGQGIVIVEQIPTKIIPEAVKNTNLRIMLRLTSRDDRDFLGDAMNFTEAQKLFVTGLTSKEGRDIQYVIFEESIDQPRLLTLPLLARKKQPEGWLFDEYFKPPSENAGGG